MHRRDVRMLGAEEPPIQVERRSVEFFGLVGLSAVANDEREVVLHRRRVRMDFAEPPQIEVEHLTVEPLCFRQLPLLVKQDGEVVHRSGCLEVIGPE